MARGDARLAALERQVAALEARGLGLDQFESSNPLFIGPTGHVESPPAGISKAELEAALALYALLAGREGGQTQYGGLKLGQTLVLYANQESAFGVTISDAVMTLTAGMVLSVEQIEGLNALIANIATFNELEVTEKLYSKGLVTAPELTAEKTDNYKVPAETAGIIYRLKSNKPVKITGIKLTGTFESEKGREIVLTNVGTEPITLIKESAASTDKHRFAIPGDIELKANETKRLFYDTAGAATSRWRLAA